MSCCALVDMLFDLSVIPDAVLSMFALVNLLDWLSMALGMDDGLVLVKSVELEIAEPTKPHFIEPTETLPEGNDETKPKFKKNQPQNYYFRFFYV